MFHDILIIGSEFIFYCVLIVEPKSFREADIGVDIIYAQFLKNFGQVTISCIHGNLEFNRVLSYSVLFHDATNLFHVPVRPTGPVAILHFPHPLMSSGFIEFWNRNLTSAA